MLPENVSIIVDLPQFETIEIYPVHDLHYGNEMFDAHKWNELAKLIHAEDNRFIVWVGDLMENAVPNSKSDVFSQTKNIREQEDFVESIFKEFADRTLAIVDGNHEFNRSTRMAGMFPLYNAACVARIDDKYRSSFAVLDVGFGQNSGNRMSRAVGFIAHQAKDLKQYGSIDALEGFDFKFCGHDHEPEDHPRAHLFYDRQRRELSLRNVEKLNSGSFLKYGGYGARLGMRPKSEKMYKLILHARPNRQKSVETLGFYL